MKPHPFPGIWVELLPRIVDPAVTLSELIEDGKKLEGADRGKAHSIVVAMGYRFAELCKCDKKQTRAVIDHINKEFE